MSVSKDKNRGTWTLYTRYKDWAGKQKVLFKRGFKTKKEAQEFEREFLLNQSRDIDMSFESFVLNHYLPNIRTTIEESTYQAKMFRMKKHILPYFSTKGMRAITAADILQWQDNLSRKKDVNGKHYTCTYLRVIRNDLNAVFNHAYKFYDLKKIPTQIVSKMGKSKGDEIEYWTKDEYEQFIATMIDEPKFYYAFEILFFTGIREGELFGLKRKDFDFKNRILTIRRQYQVINGKGKDKKPKSESGFRTMAIPKRLAEEIEEYCDSIYECNGETRLFEYGQSALLHAKERGCKRSGVKKITVHALRHSHVAYLISLGFNLYEIGKRLGHSDKAMTERYAHLTTSRMMEVANRIDADLEKND